MKLHLLFLTSWFPNPNNWQDGNFIERHAKAVAQINQVSLLFVTPFKGQKDIYDWNIQSEKNYTAHSIYYKPHWLFMVHYYRKFKAYYLGLKRIGGYDMVHLNVIYPAGIIALVLKVINRKPYVVTEHWTRFTQINPNFSFFQKILIRNIANHAKVILPVSSNLGKQIQKIGIKTPIQIIPNVVDTDVFYPIESQNKVSTFLHVSSLNNQQKNITGILDAFVLVNNTTKKYLLKIGGNGDLNWLKSEIKIRNLQNNTMVLPSLQPNQVAENMQTSDCFVLFSNYETQGCVVAESLACGTPVISTDLESVTQYLPEKFSWLVPKGNIQALSQTLLDFIETFPNHNLSKNQMHSFAQEQFSVKTISNQYNTVYRQCLDLNL